MWALLSASLSALWAWEPPCKAARGREQRPSPEGGQTRGLPTGGLLGAAGCLEGMRFLNGLGHHSGSLLPHARWGSWGPRQLCYPEMLCPPLPRAEGSSDKAQPQDSGAPSLAEAQLTDAFISAWRGGS